MDVPLSEIRAGVPPRDAPWKTPLDRATYPRRRAKLTAGYRAWLSASVADLAGHLSNAFLESQSDAKQAQTYLAGARVLTAAAVALLRDDLDELEKLAVGVDLKESTPTRVPTRLYVTTLRGTASCELPFWIGGQDVARTRVDGAEQLLFFFISRLRISAPFLDGSPGKARAIGRALAEEFALSAPVLPLVRTRLGQNAVIALGKDFGRLLDNVASTPEPTTFADVAESDVKFARLAPRFAQTALVRCGYTRTAARNQFEYRRKREDRRDESSAGRRRQFESRTI